MFLDLSKNEELKNTISTLKLRVFSFALKSYRDRFKREIVKEHKTFISLLRNGERDQAVAFLKDIHWKFNYPENFVRMDGSEGG